MKQELLSEIEPYIKCSEVGIEKESLRYLNSKISQEPHPKSLGSSLCNSYITTDFSEAQLEFITPPFSDKRKALNFLLDIHHFFYSSVDDEMLWPFSMPFYIGKGGIPIAKFGTSSKGLFKHVYRKGLSHRYGRLMQTISGVHFNYSLPRKIWTSSIFKNHERESLELRSENYFSILRNVLRMNWLILYLFGCSPSITKDFLSGLNDDFVKLDKNTLFSPYGTSIRMSEYGYQNLSRAKINISTNSLNSYTTDLLKATNQKSDSFSKIFDETGDTLSQINANQLQIEDEYYAAARAKSIDKSDVRFAKKLLNGGVDFIELRSLDLDPYSPIGISEETIIFLEIFMLYAFVKESDPINKIEEKQIFKNDIKVAKMGRKPNLKLVRNDKNISLTDWANEILDEMLPIANFLDNHKEIGHSENIELMRARINDPSLTPSAMILESLIEKRSFIRLGESISHKNKLKFLELNSKNNSNWKKLNIETESSIKKQCMLEKDIITFKEYKNKYFS
ncbi:MAG: glutamate--cysteine ligase [Chloroflexi bacterium]|nr:glutamate--cysteine ligase [Chloroflexota bacterium]